MSRRGGRGGGGRGGGKASVSKELLKRTAAEAGLDDRHLKVLSDITQPPLFPDFLLHSSGNGYWEEELPSVAELQIGGDVQPQEKKPRAAAASSTTTTPIASTKRPASTVYIMNKQRELQSRWQAGPQYVRPTQQVDVERYSTRRRQRQGNRNFNLSNTAPDAAVLACLGKTNDALATDTRYFPAELLSHLGSKIGSSDYEEDDEDDQKKRAAIVAADEVVSSHNTTAEAASQDHQDEEEDVAKGGEGEEDKIMEDEAMMANAEAGGAPEEEEEGEDYTTNYYNTDDDDDNEEKQGDDAEPTF